MYNQLHTYEHTYLNLDLDLDIYLESRSTQRKHSAIKLPTRERNGLLKMRLRCLLTSRVKLQKTNVEMRQSAVRGDGQRALQ